MKTKEEMRFEAALNFLLQKFTYQNTTLAIKESIDLADRLIAELEKTKVEKDEE